MGYVNWSPEPHKEKLENMYEIALRYPDKKFAKLLVMKDKDENVDEIYKFIAENYPDEVIANSGGDVILEIISSKYSKYDACRFISDRLGISESETITIGDSTNDFQLLSFGLGLAPENAKPALKELADHVVEDVHERPVEKIIKRLLAGEEVFTL